MSDSSDKSLNDWIEAAGSALWDRGLDYGDPRDNLLRIFRISKLLGIQLRDPSDVATIFIATKLSRLVESPGREDSYIDLIGYSAILGFTRYTDWDDFDTF